MIAHVKNSAKPTNTWFGGVCAVPSACLVIDRIIAILGKHVTAIKTEGKNTSALIIVDIFRAAKTSPLLKLLEVEVFIETTGFVGSVAARAIELQARMAMAMSIRRI